MSADPTVLVRRQWNDHRIGEVRLEDLLNIKWDQQSGGVRTRSPYPMIYGYIWCNALIGGDVGHSCQHGPPPNEVKVCVCRKDNDPGIYRSLKGQAGTKPPITRRVKSTAVKSQV